MELLPTWDDSTAKLFQEKFPPADDTMFRAVINTLISSEKVYFSSNGSCNYKSLPTPPTIFNFCQILDRSQTSSNVNPSRNPTDKFEASAARPGTKQIGDNIDRGSDYGGSDEYNSNTTNAKRKHEENQVE